MSSEILVAILGFLGTLFGSCAGAVASSRLTNYRLEQLEKKVEQHNQVIERVYKLEKADEVEKEKIKVIDHRIDDLEAYHKS